jgi:hypothetical protein
MARVTGKLEVDKLTHYLKIEDVRWEVEEMCEKQAKTQKETINIRDSLVVTHWKV